MRSNSIKHMYTHLTKYLSACAFLIVHSASVTRGSCAQGWIDGAGTGAAAAFNDPWGVAVDSSGNVLVAEWSNNRVRDVTV